MMMSIVPRWQGALRVNSFTRTPTSGRMYACPLFYFVSILQKKKTALCKFSTIVHRGYSNGFKPGVKPWQ